MRGPQVESLVSLGVFAEVLVGRAIGMQITFPLTYLFTMKTDNTIVAGVFTHAYFSVLYIFVYN